MKRVALYVLLACATFLSVVAVRVKASRALPNAAAPVPVDAPDSVQLAALGIRPGPQLIAYVFGSSRCGYCNSPETKRAIAMLRDSLGRQVSTGAAATVTVIGIAVNTDLRDGLGYLEGIGPGAFDQISIGSGWQNEHVVRLLRRERIAEEALPLVIVVRRPMTATLAPLSVGYGADSVLTVVQGSSAIGRWVSSGAPTAVRNPVPLDSARRATP